MSMKNEMPNTPVVKPVKKTRGDLLHEQMVRNGMLKEVRRVNRKHVAIRSLIVLAVLGIILGVIQFRLNTVEAWQEEQAATEAVTISAKDLLTGAAVPASAKSLTEKLRVQLDAKVEAGEITAEEAAAHMSDALALQNAINATEQADTSGEPADASYASIYRLARLLLIVGMGIFVVVAIIQLLAPKRRKPNRSVWGDIGIYLLLFIIAVAMAFPLIFSIGSSLKPLDELFRFPPRVLPSHPTFDNFSDLFVTMGQSWVPFSRYLVNTVLITFIGTFGHLIVCSMAAFVLAKYNFPGGRTFFNIVVTALMFSGYVTGIPNYVIMSKLHMIDTYWAILLPAFAAPIGLFLMKQFMENLPNSLIEAAHLDGAGEFRIFWSIIMPNVKPAWLTLIIFSVQNLWNTNASTVIYSEAKKTLVYALQQIQAGGIARTGQAAAVTVIVMLVPILIFILSQSQILETMASSGLKD